jgi:hypothetical protein
MRFIHLYSAFLLCIFASGCSHQQPETDFYYWKTTLDFTPQDRNLCQQIGTQRLYVRFFDINWNSSFGMGVPVGVLQVKKTLNDPAVDGLLIIPTVFIVNRVFEQTRDDQLAVLAKKTATKIRSIARRTGAKSFRNYSEIQIDCDWTATTRDRFFQFLRQLQLQEPHLRLTCTLRLHQYRDRRLMGIPPVRSAVLMCYNTGNVKNRIETNSILNLKDVNAYLKGKTYPLPLDVALPMFQWGAWYRGIKFQGLLGALSLESAKKTSFLKLVDPPNRFQVTADTVFQGSYLRLGDAIRIDGPTTKSLKATIGQLKKKLGNPVKRVVWFDWEYENVRQQQKQLGVYAKFF